MKIAPSILSADFARLGQQVKEAEAAGADWIHVDVMDGHFVPNITLGPPIVRALRSATHLPLDVHLMIADPARYLTDFEKAGANSLTVHVETCLHLHRVIQQIKDLGLKAGVALNPATPLGALEEVLRAVDLVVLMTVNPGFGGQSYIPASTAKIARLRQMLFEMEAQAELEVDGGINRNTIVEAVEAGATVLVAGSAIYNDQASVAKNIRQLREVVHL